MNADGPIVAVDDHVEADLRWFTKYLEQYNGRSIIPEPEPTQEIYADACTDGFGAHTEGRAYGLPVSEAMTREHSISELECLNCLVAARTFLGKKDRGRRIRINCDNEATIYAYTGGGARNKVLAACSHAMWMLGASLNIAFVFRHIPGVEMTLADALSRMHKHTQYREIVDRNLDHKNVKFCFPSRAAYNYANFV